MLISWEIAGNESRQSELYRAVLIVQALPASFFEVFPLLRNKIIIQLAKLATFLRGIL
jgi:hypothetical protein